MERKQRTRKRPKKSDEYVFEDDGYFEIGEIVEVREVTKRKKKLTECLVRWKGYNDLYNSWEPIDNVQHTVAWQNWKQGKKPKPDEEEDPEEEEQVSKKTRKGASSRKKNAINEIPDSIPEEVTVTSPVKTPESILIEVFESDTPPTNYVAPNTESKLESSSAPPSPMDENFHFPSSPQSVSIPLRKRKSPDPKKRPTHPHQERITQKTDLYLWPKPKSKDSKDRLRSFPLASILHRHAPSLQLDLNEDDSEGSEEGDGGLMEMEKEETVES
eukprot:TRINITY_DN3554_c0_g1_i2.p1 TRINITY_DN3554_c0_g1~~TRINITY_DN3554_c0_g1_i2.p1  ORF type:complete len:272 (+),score=44.68 TRINITY_DN3554_c0_g1_i2:140-955(+)